MPAPVKEVEVVPAKKPSIRLVHITFDKAPRIAGVRAGDLGTIDPINPVEPLRGWRAMLKGAMMVLISPPGWASGRPARDWNPEGPCTVHEIPRANCYLKWEGDEEALDQIMKPYVSEPFGKPIEVVPTPEKAFPPPVNPAELGDE